MITDDFYKKRMRQYYTDEEAFRIVYSFLEDKAKEASRKEIRKRNRPTFKYRFSFSNET